MLEAMIAGGIRVAAVLLLLMGIVVLLRDASAATRHAVWRAGFAMALVLPLVALTLPWKLAVLPAAETSAVAPASMPYEPGSVTPDAESDADDGSWNGASTSKSSSSAPTTHDRSVTWGEAPVAGERAEWQAPSPQGAGIDWVLLLGGLWLAGALLLAARLVAGHWAVRRIARTGRHLTTSDWTAPLYEAADIVDVAVDVELVQSDRVTMPFTAGVRRPVIVMPATADGWDLERRRAVLMHELAHVRRRDLIPHHVARWVCALHWFNPLAWLGARRMRVESERAADDLVLAAGTRASDYADHLLQIVSSAGRSLMPAPALPLAQRREFEGRMLAILEPGLRRGGSGRVQSIVVTALVLVLTLPLAALERERPADVAASSEWLTGGASDDEPTALEGIGGAAAREEASHVDDMSGSLATLLDTPSFPVPPAEPVKKVDLLNAIIGNALEVALPIAGEIVTSATVDVVPQLVSALGDENFEVRESVVASLGELADPRAVQALMRVLRTDTVDAVRAAAAWALGEIEDPAAVPALIHAVRNDVCEEVRKNAAWALGQIEDPAAVEALGAALRDSNEEVRRTAVWALGEIESPDAVPSLISALDSDDVEVRRTAVWSLGQIEDARAVPSLLPLVDDQDAEVREAALHALAQIEDPAAAPAMIRALGDPDADLRAMAAMSLADMGLGTAPQPLVAALRDASADVRMAAAHALGEIADPATVPALTAALDDANDDVRMGAMHALLEMDSEVATDALLELLDHDDPNVRKQAAEMLGQQ
ncbi:MAG TPA: HEAT repeat domain-containing protein [Longimicrobiales bacterium]